MEIVTRAAICGVLELEKNQPKGNHIRTGDIRSLSASLFQQMKKHSIDQVLFICDELLGQLKWELGVIAFDFAYQVRKQYDEKTYEVFYRWLKDYVRGWGDCDDFCTHAFGELICQQKELFTKVVSWTEDQDFWMRRASAVIMIPTIKKMDCGTMDPFLIADHLLQDEHDLVLKGYGWMLKEYALVDQPAVEKYLINNHDKMPRVAFRYALEKFDKETRDRLMSI